jgi:hypothetical protein
MWMTLTRANALFKAGIKSRCPWCGQGHITRDGKAIVRVSGYATEEDVQPADTTAVAEQPRTQSSAVAAAAAFRTRQMLQWE